MPIATIFAAAVVATASPASAADEAGVRVAIAGYGQGLRTGDRAAFDRAFDPDGMFFRRSADTGAVSGRRFADVTPGWTPDPKSTLEVRRIVFTSRTMASVDLTLRYDGTVFRDQLSLYRTAAGWRIVAKLTEVVSEP